MLRRCHTNIQARRKHSLQHSFSQIEFQVTITERQRGLFTVKTAEIEDTKTIKLNVPNSVSKELEQAFHKIRNTVGQ